MTNSCQYSHNSVTWLWMRPSGDTVPGCSSDTVCVTLLINCCVYSSNINFCKLHGYTVHQTMLKSFITN